MPTGHQELRDTQPASVELHLYYRSAMARKSLIGCPKVIGRQVAMQFQWPEAPPVTTAKASKTVLLMNNGMCIEAIHLARKSGQLIAISKMLKSFLKNYL